MDPEELRRLAGWTVARGSSDLIEAMMKAGLDPTDDELWSRTKKEFLAYMKVAILRRERGL